MCRFVLGRFAGSGFCFVRAGNAFWSSLLQLAAQVLVPGAGDVASALTSRAALAVGRLSHPLITQLVFFSCSWVAKCNTASTHTEQHDCNKNNDHLTEETGGRAGETERPKTSRPPGALVSTRAPSQPRTSRVLSVAPPGPDRPAQTSPRALQGYEAGLTEASLAQSVGWQLNRRP